MTTLKGLVATKNDVDIMIFSDLAGFTTTGCTIPVHIIMSKLKPDLVMYKEKETPSILLN